MLQESIQESENSCQEANQNQRFYQKVSSLNMHVAGMPQNFSLTLALQCRTQWVLRPT